MKQILIIDGWWGSGKSTLRGLLDGHPELMVSPVQEAFFGGLAQVPNLKDILEMKDLGEFRKALWGLTDYNRLEKEARSKGVFNFAGGSDATYNAFEFDFYAFDQAFVNMLSGLESWNLEEISTGLFQLIMQYWKGEPAEGKTTAVGMDNNLNGAVELILKDTLSTKYIWVDRNSYEVTAAHAKRKTMENSVGTKGWGNTKTRHVVKDGRIFAHEQKREAMKKLQKQYPERVKVVPLESLVLETKEAMKGVADFLGIDYAPILERYTYRGQDFEGSDRFVGKVNDTPESIFSSDQMKILEGEISTALLGKRSIRNQVRAVRQALRSAKRVYYAYFRYL